MTDKNHSKTLAEADGGRTVQPTKGLHQSAPLSAAGIAAVLASACCIGSWVLVTIGLGGAWAANLTLLEPLRPIFLLIAAAALVVAYRRIFPATPAGCESGKICAPPKTDLPTRRCFGW